MIKFNVKSRGQGKSVMNKFLILQWGSKRSIIQNVSDINNPILIVDNEYLMNLDEMGLILNG